MSSTYTIKDGDTLFSIAQSTYGDGNQYTKIQQANPSVNPTALQVGATLQIP